MSERGKKLLSWKLTLLIVLIALMNIVTLLMLDLYGSYCNMEVNETELW